MGQCVSKPPDGYTAPPPPGAAHLVGMGLANGSSASGGVPGAGGGVHGGGGHGGGGHHGAAGGGGHGAGAHADTSVHAAHAALGKRSFRSSNRSVIEGLASIYQVKAVLGSGAWQRNTERGTRNANTKCVGRGAEDNGGQQAKRLVHLGAGVRQF